MRGFYSILPTLSPDFSGVCSTLFELGGILAIHDAGGCTGTYTGYDLSLIHILRENQYPASDVKTL